ncbi:hypothetical protein EDD22DRAFT_847899 [Suillus occidentalis]|nr:hypothetical protein EDD22DRAFT_847899 [Suillus occidentalis]
MSEHLVNNPHVIQGSDGNVHAIGNVIVMNIDELTHDWHTYCVDINPEVPGPFISASATKFVVNIKEKSTSLATQPEAEDSISLATQIKTEDASISLATQPKVEDSISLATQIKTKDLMQVIIKQEDCEDKQDSPDDEHYHVSKIIKRDHMDDVHHHVTPRCINLLKCRQAPGLFHANGKRSTKVAHVHSYYISPRRNVKEKENTMTMT